MTNSCYCYSCSFLADDDDDDDDDDEEEEEKVEVVEEEEDQRGKPRTHANERQDTVHSNNYWRDVTKG